MFCSIIIDEENKNILRTMYNENISNIKLTIKCNYFAYPDKILNYTSIPKVIVNLICEYIDDEITFNSTSLHLPTFKATSRRTSTRSASERSTTEHLLLDSIIANINFTNIKINLLLADNFQEIIDFNKCETPKWKFLSISENIIICKDSTYIHDISIHTYDIFKIMTNKHTKFKKISKYVISHIDDTKLRFEIVNYEILLIICNIIYTLLDTYKQCSKQKN